MIRLGECGVQASSRREPISGQQLKFKKTEIEKTLYFRSFHCGSCCSAHWNMLIVVLRIFREKFLPFTHELREHEQQLSHQHPRPEIFNNLPYKSNENHVRWANISIRMFEHELKD